MSFEINKVYTDNPYVDELVYYTKQLGFGTVLKMQDVADNSETVESLKAGGLYISCVEGNATLKQFEVTREDLHNIGIVASADIDKYLEDPSLLEPSKRVLLTKNLRAKYIANYEELNPYYRMLHGLPARGHEDYVTEYWVPHDGLSVDITKPVHMMNDAEIMILENYGVLEEMIDDDSENRQYMRHLGKKKIDYYK